MPQLGETRTHKNSVYRFDGREWVKVGPAQGAAASAPPALTRIGPTTPVKEKPVARGQVVDPIDPTRMLEVDLNRYQKGASLGDEGVFGVAGKLPGSYSPKEVNTAKLKLGSLSLAKAQLQALRDYYSEIKNTTMAGPESGLYPSGFREKANLFDTAVDNIRNTIGALTRIPGIGAMSDYETRLAASQLPSRFRRERSIEESISNLENLISATESGYSDILKSSGVDYSPPSVTSTSRMSEEYNRVRALQEEARKELERRRSAQPRK